MEDEVHGKAWYSRRLPPLLPAAKEHINQSSTEVTLPPSGLLSADQSKLPRHDADILL